MYWSWQWTLLRCFWPFSIRDIAKCASDLSAPAVWYSLPRTVPHSPSLTVFKYGLKTNFFDEAHNMRQWCHDLCFQCFWSYELAAGQKCVYYHPNTMHVDVTYRYRWNSMVCLLVWHDCEQCKNGWTHQDVIWDVNFGLWWAQVPLDGIQISPREGANLTEGKGGPL